MSRAESPSFGRYHLIQEIGRGGESIVHLAQDTVLDRRVALKIFPRTAASGSVEPPPGFRREVEVLSRLCHPGICVVHDAGIEDGSAFIAMSYIEGVTLAEHGSIRDESDAVRIAEDVAGIIAAAHAIGVVHGDLKPANVVATSGGRCVVLDFGVARLLDEPSGSRQSRLAGTLPYLAPECLAAAPDARADVYGLGAVLFELVSGRPPYLAPTRALLLRAIERDDPPLLRAVAPRASRDLEAVIAKALDRDPARRYATMSDFAADLGRLRSGVPASARRFGPVGRSARWARRHPAAAALAAFLAVFVALVASVVALQNLRLRAHLDRAEVEARRARDASRAAQDDLVRFERLADRRRIADLEARAAALVPPHPTRLPALAEWLEEAEPLVRRLDEHRHALANLRSRGRASEPEPAGIIGAGGRDRTPLTRELAALESRHARLLGDPNPPAGTNQLGALIRRLQVRQSSPVRWTYDSARDAGQDEALAALIADLERFADPDCKRGTVADVRRRIEDVRTLERLLAARAEAWEQACASIADPAQCPAYRGLVIGPQLGLVPLGRDSASGLWEFQHVLSGEEPQRTLDGRLELLPESGIVLVLVPGGVTRIGAQQPEPGGPASGPHLDPLAAPNESPVVDVSLDAYFISKFEMTEPQWERVRGRAPAASNRSTAAATCWPVCAIDWNDASRVLARLGLELPTEAQWEHAARAGSTTPWWSGQDAASLSEAAVCSAQVAAPVGQKRPNSFGLHDVAGNATEWCRDGYAPYGAPRAAGTGAAIDGVDADLRVRRGGGFRHPAAELRSARRTAEPVSARPVDAGVRPARVIDR